MNNERKIRIKGILNFNQLKSFDISGSEVGKNYIKKVIKKISRNYNLSEDLAKVNFIIAISTQGFAEDHMYDHEVTSTFKSLKMDITFYNKKLLKDMCEDLF